MGADVLYGIMVYRDRDLSYRDFKQGESPELVALGKRDASAFYSVLRGELESDEMETGLCQGETIDPSR